MTPFSPTQIDVDGVRAAWCAVEPRSHYPVLALHEVDHPTKRRSVMRVDLQVDDLAAGPG